MYIFSCERSWEAMLTCIYEAMVSKKGHQDIKLMFEPVEQLSLFDVYTQVEPDQSKAELMMDAINQKISPRIYQKLLYVSMAYEEDIMDLMYRVLLLCFSFGPSAWDMVQYKEVMRINQICTRLGKEVNRFQEFSRFHQIGSDLYVAHIEPKSRLVVALGPIFMDRMPSENFVIIDDVHREAVIHPRDEDFFLKQLDDNEYHKLLETEQANDTFTDLWQVFFDTIAIEERKNAKCQRNLMPLWTRKHAVEFL